MRLALTTMASRLRCWRSSPPSRGSTCQQPLGVALDDRDGLSQVVGDGAHEVVALLLQLALHRNVPVCHHSARDAPVGTRIGAPLADNQSGLPLGDWMRRSSSVTTSPRSALIGGISSKRRGVPSGFSARNRPERSPGGRDQCVLRVAEHLLGGAVQMRDPPLLVVDDDRLGHRRHGGLHLGRPLCRLLAPGPARAAGPLLSCSLDCRRLASRLSRSLMSVTVLTAPSTSPRASRIGAAPTT